MEPEGSLPHSQEFLTCSYPEPEQSTNPVHVTLKRVSGAETSSVPIPHNKQIDLLVHHIAAEIWRVVRCQRHRDVLLPARRDSSVGIATGYGFDFQNGKTCPIFTASRLTLYPIQIFLSK
jgi:hypothetical protein